MIFKDQMMEEVEALRINEKKNKINNGLNNKVEECEKKIRRLITHSTEKIVNI